MTDFSSVSIPPPSNWQDFERNIRLLFEHSLCDPHTQNNGRQGQAQHGVDVYGRRGGGNGPLVGVQCKGTYRDLIRNHRPQTAIDLLTKLKGQVWATASARVRFRILSNIGAAHHQLGHFDVAADFFLEAAPFNPDDPVCFANNIAAVLIKGRMDEARVLASEAFERFPDNADISMQRLQARAPGETVDVVWRKLSPSVKGNVKLLMYRATTLREERDHAWRDVVAEALRLHPDDLRLKAMQAEGVLERLLTADPSAAGRASNEVPTHAELVAAADVFEAMWNNTSGRETPPEGSFAHNAALIRSFLHQNDAAEKLLDAALTAGFAIDETRRLRISLYMRAGKTPEAIALADTLEDYPQARIIRADLRLPNAGPQARTILANRDTFTDPKDIVAASWVVIDSFLAEANYDAALQEAERLLQRLPDDPHSFLTQYRAKCARGDTDADQALSEAAQRLTDDIVFSTRFFVAEALSKAHRFDEAVDVLRTHTSTRYDSAALRTLIAAAANSDRRATLKDLLESLPEAILELPFYRNAKIALAVKSGDMKAAEREIRANLALRPRNLELQIQLMRLLFRQDRIRELRDQAQRPASEFDGSPEDLIQLAQFKEAFADWRDAHQLAYETLLAHRNNARVNLGYVGVFLRPGHSKELDIAPPVVADNLAVAVHSEEGSTTVYVIEPNPLLRPTPNYLASNHRIAESLFGKPVGAEVQLPDTTKGTIEWIKPKVLHELHEVLNNFQNHFPEAQGLQRVSVRPGPGGLAPVLERIHDRHDATEQIAKLYDSGNVAIAVAGKMLGLDPVETFVGFVSTGHPIQVCVGTHEERQLAFAALRDNARKGCVVDAITLHIIRRLGLGEVVRAACGAIGITDATALHVRKKIHELKERIDEPDMSMFWRDGQYYREETSPEQKRQILAHLEADDQWIAQNTETLPAQGTKDPTPQVRELLATVGSDFIDDILAAEGSGRLLLSEDQTLRAVAGAEFSVKATWLQPVLMQALDEGQITRDKYAEALAGFIDGKLDFISIDSLTLLETLKDAQSHRLPANFSKLASRLGGKKADMASHIGVAARTIKATWRNEQLTWTVRQAIVGTLLFELSKERALAEFAIVLRAFAQIGQQLRDARFADYLGAWLQGHFIKLS